MPSIIVYDPFPPLAHIFFFFLIFYSYFIYLFIFIFGCVGSSVRARAFSSCGKRGLLFVVVRGFLIAVVSPVAEHGL